jgi:hypothetical protein
MWKTVVLCASLFGSAVLALSAAVRWVEPTVLPGAAAIGLCLVGVVLILVAPGRSASTVPPPLTSEARPLAAPTLRSAFAHSAPRLDAMVDEGYPQT